MDTGRNFSIHNLKAISVSAVLSTSDYLDSLSSAEMWCKLLHAEITWKLTSTISLMVIKIFHMQLFWYLHFMECLYPIAWQLRVYGWLCVNDGTLHLTKHTLQAIYVIKIIWFLKHNMHFNTKNGYETSFELLSKECAQMKLVHHFLV